MRRKRTKVICTIGPASQKPAVMKSLMRAGMNVARQNFSHGTHAGHRKLLRDLRRSSKELGLPIAILGDLQGPKIRLGELPKKGVTLRKGKTVRFSTAASAYKDGGPLPVTYAGLHKDVKPGHRFLIDDGLLELTILAVRGKVIEAKVVNGGTVTSHKGMNFPDSILRVSAITAKDRKDVAFMVENGVDWVALSFVKDAKDVRLLRRLIRAAGKRGQVLPRIIVKIEKHEAIANFDVILKETDGVMVARGDLGIEIDAEEVPVRQKEIIEKCRLAGKPVAVATQMLDSMIRNPRPTRAEVSDVANAVFDHADAVMLSGESATGKYPLKTVQMMTKIVKEAEASPYDDVPLLERADKVQTFATTIQVLGLKGDIDGVLADLSRAPWAETSLMMHPEIPFFLACPDETLARQNALRWGAVPFTLKPGKPETFVRRATAYLKKHKLIKHGQKLAVIQGGAHGKGVDIIRP